MTDSSKPVERCTECELTLQDGVCPMCGEESLSSKLARETARADAAVEELAQEKSSHQLTLHAYEQTVKIVASRDAQIAEMGTNLENWWARFKAEYKSRCEVLAQLEKARAALRDLIFYSARLVEEKYLQDAREVLNASGEATMTPGNPHGYEAGFTIEQFEDDYLIRRLGKAIKRINKLEAALEYIERARPDGVQLVAAALSNAENKS